MNANEWMRVKELFVVALPLAGDARAQFLSTACGADHALREHVESLLASHEDAHTFLEVSPSLPEESSPSIRLEGLRIGPYQISARLGAGGMGEVYKARDTRLDRTVAIKVLPPHVARDTLARDRFEREARAVAALNHPHICTLHDIGCHDGIDFLVMEFLDGETLGARISKGPLPLPQALQHAIQIASALDRVHRASIVHRDLKPGNIMVTRAGAKLLDFGLSKSSAAMPAPDESTRLSTPAELTTTGTIVGTVQYMAPEQIDGRTADARSDIFAFGAVFYEMLTGTKAFKGNSVSSVMAAIRDDEPAPLTGVTVALDRVVRTCLAKDPDDRWQTARDLLRELEWIAQGPVKSDAAVLESSLRRARALGAVAALGAIALPGAALVMYLHSRWSGVEGLPARFEIATPSTSDPTSFAVSPDGRQLVFVSTDNGVSRLWLRPIDQLTQQPLAHTDGASYPFWAPDGRSVAFFAEGKLKRLDLGGAPAQVLADAPNGRGGTWNSAGMILFAPATAGPLMRMAATGGAAVPATRLTSGQNSHRWPHFLPDGKRFLFHSTLSQLAGRGVFIGDLESSEVTRLVDDDSPAVYAPPQTLLFMRNGALVAADVDIERRSIQGEPRILLQPIGFDAPVARAAFSLSDAGVLAYRTAVASDRRLVWTDRSGKVLNALGPVDSDALASPELTPDGRRITVFRSLAGNVDVWLINVDGGIPSRFTFDANTDGFPIWSQDGQRVVFISNRNGQYTLFERAAVGAGDERPIGSHPELRIPLDFSPDGRFLLYCAQVPDTGADLWALPLNDLNNPVPFARTAFNEVAGQFSPDGRWVAYQSNASGRMEVYVAPFPGPGSSDQVSSAGGAQPRWGPNGKELFYVASDGRMMAVPISGEQDTFRYGSPIPLFQTSLATGANIPPAAGTKAQYDVTADGRFLMNVSVEGAVAPPIAVALNWQAALNR